VHGARCFRASNHEVVTHQRHDVGTAVTTTKPKTGCAWERWVKALDRVQAHTWPHRRIAEYVHEKYKVPH